ncbi:uncharacterized protein B0H18DRAFT_521823 [Fomitopsis serialis]|uniref:uncharacterized protein n=1 Tax=Fomitopsis serialis TaxID=139415 RepID=UPI002008A2F0|nr:uncharacterized protein B0H18DRAFT_521823 [Neoantrodia serialis]KAH9922181.1 hypothetical protein B0H18DRAFT_521823 [Neoantrodia serialis]
MDTEVRRLELARNPDDPWVDYYRQLKSVHLYKQPKTWPDSKLAYDGGLDQMNKSINLQGQTLQIIVKLANIVLTPDKPEYDGGKWYVEAIVATLIYYYDCENMSESTLSFRNAVNEPRYHGQDDSYCRQGGARTGGRECGPASGRESPGM